MVLDRQSDRVLAFQQVSSASRVRHRATGLLLGDGDSGTTAGGSSMGEGAGVGVGDGVGLGLGGSTGAADEDGRAGTDKVTTVVGEIDGVLSFTTCAVAGSME